MGLPRIATREEWLAARTALLAAEKELTRRRVELSRQRRELPMVEITKECEEPKGRTESVRSATPDFGS